MEFSLFYHHTKEHKIKTMKNLMTFLASIIFSGIAVGQNNLGEVIGEVVKKGTIIPAFGAHVFIDDNGTKFNASVGADGRFRMSGIPAGEYIVNIKYEGDTMSNIFAEVPMDGFYNIGKIDFDSKIQIVEGADVVAEAKIKMVDGNLPVTMLTYKEIEKSPVKMNMKELINSMSSDVRMTSDGSLVFRGARKGDMLYLMDGVKTTTVTNVPSASIGRMMIYSGGLPAKYGDTLGGVVVMETKSYFDLYRRWVGQQIREGKM